MCYFSHALQFPQITVDSICHAMNDPKFGRVDFIAGTGISGNIVLLPVSMKSGIPCGAVRKVTEVEKTCYDGGSHSCTIVETFLPIGHCVYRYVIIDDLVESGSTIHKIGMAMEESYPHSRCVGIILYQNYPRESYTSSLQGIPVTNLSDDIILLDALVKNERRVFA